MKGDVYIDQNQSLTSLEGLNKLDSVASVFYIYNNSSLTSLQGLNKLKTVGKSFDIYNNEALKSLDGLEALNQVNGNMYTRNNAQLSNFCALSTLAQNNALSEQTWSSEGNINNPFWMEVVDGIYCKTIAENNSTENTNSTESLTYPGKDLCYVANDMLNIKLAKRTDAIYEIRLYSTLGSAVYINLNAVIENGQYSTNIQHLSTGVYIVQLLNKKLNKYSSTKVLVE